MVTIPKFVLEIIVVENILLYLIVGFIYCIKIDSKIDVDPDLRGFFLVCSFLLAWPIYLIIDIIIAITSVYKKNENDD